MVGIPKERNLVDLEKVIRDQLAMISTLANRLDELGDAFTIKGIRYESKKIIWELELLEDFLKSYEKAQAVDEPSDTDEKRQTNSTDSLNGFRQ